MPLRLSISSLLHTWLDFALPRSCLLCGTQTASVVCTACRTDLPLLSRYRCPICTTPLAAEAPACGTCLKQRPAFDATHAAFRYAFPVDRMVLGLKFGQHGFARRLASADFFAACLLAAVAQTAAPALGTIIVPVPLSRLRLRERGFNQALEIARPLARTLQLCFDATSLVRVRETLPQSQLPWRARTGNVRHAFACQRDFSGHSVIVVDDVMTTGATLDAIARTLKDHGAAHVTNWVVARAVKRSI